LLQRLDEDGDDLGIGQPVVAVPPRVLHHQQPAGDQLVKMAAGGRRADFRLCGQPAGRQRPAVRGEGDEYLALGPVGDKRPDTGQVTIAARGAGRA
jgi:hypothetical protein